MKAQRRSKGKLPLDDPRWRTIEEAIEHRYKQTRSYALTADDLNEALRRQSGRRLRSLSRQRDKRELLSAATWRDDLYVNVCWFPGEPERGILDWKEGAAVFSRERGGAHLQGRWIFVWGPDLEKLWPNVTPSEQRADDEPSTKRRPGPRANWRLPAAAEIHRIRKEEGRTPTAPELCMFCDKTLDGYPDESEMRALIRFLLGE